MPEPSAQHSYSVQGAMGRAATITVTVHSPMLVELCQQHGDISFVFNDLNGPVFTQLVAIQAYLADGQPTQQPSLTVWERESALAIDNSAAIHVLAILDMELHHPQAKRALRQLGQLIDQIVDTLTPKPPPSIAAAANRASRFGAAAPGSSLLVYFSLVFLSNITWH